MDLVRVALVAALLTGVQPVSAQPVSSQPTGPQPASVPSSTDPYAAAIAEAADRFAIPEQWIRAVMQAESAGDPSATSHAGAMGLMQIMPGTWATLRARYRLGSNPYAVRDNILAGAAYLREMHDRYGSPAFLAAYNAGPGRLDQHLREGRPLPAETRRYLATVGPALGAKGAAVLTSPARTVAPEPPPETLFAVRHDARTEFVTVSSQRAGEGLFAIRRSVQPDQIDAPDVQPE